MRRKSLSGVACPIARTLDVIGDWWSMLIIREALFGSRRFGEFQKTLGLAKNILTVRLRALVDQGILKMAPASDGSAYQEYRLTDKGRSLYPVLISLALWGQDNAPTSGPKSQLVDREHGRPVRSVNVIASDGRVLKAGETKMVRGAG